MTNRAEWLLNESHRSRGKAGVPFAMELVDRNNFANEALSDMTDPLEDTDPFEDIVAPAGMTPGMSRHRPGRL
jgi:hypothetical protein